MYEMVHAILKSRDTMIKISGDDERSKILKKNLIARAY